MPQLLGNKPRLAPACAAGWLLLGVPGAALAQTSGQRPPTDTTHVRRLSSVEVRGETTPTNKITVSAEATASPAAVTLVGFSKTVLRWQPWMFKPVGQRFEFVPEPFSGPLRAGQPFRVRLLLDGQPLANAMVENNSNEEGPRTDASGAVTITLVKGVNRLANDLDIAQMADPDATRLSLTAALVFVAE